jgi:hypothetical protein
MRAWKALTPERKAFYFLRVYFRPLYPKNIFVQRYMKMQSKYGLAEIGGIRYGCQVPR